MIPFVLLLFPIVRRIVYRIGLPWVKTAERYSELWRQEFERWLDEEHERRGFDPALSKAASGARKMAIAAKTKLILCQLSGLF
ncbi:MAG: hypothetical protein ACYS30_16165 [Planctomycetota bacterium]|jgi:hypothetical protein